LLLCDFSHRLTKTMTTTRITRKQHNCECPPCCYLSVDCGLSNTLNKVRFKSNIRNIFLALKHRLATNDELVESISILPSGKNRQKKSSLKEWVLLIRQSKCSAMLSKIHSYRLLFRRFYPLGMG